MNSGVALLLLFACSQGGASNANITYSLRKSRGSAGLDVFVHENGKRTNLGSSLNLTEGKAAGRGQTVVVIGAGMGGLTSAYQLLKDTSFHVIVLEARDRVGGRSTTFRSGESFNEIMPNGETITQKVKFDWPQGDAEPYLNAGPGRIPSAHRNTINYCNELGVELEVYVKESRSNLLYVDGKFDNKPMVNRRLNYDTRGHFASRLFSETSDTKLRAWLRSYGSLNSDGSYTSSSRDGYQQMPGIEPGIPEIPLSFNDMLDSEFWSEGIYSVDSFTQQPTSFQPRGGMDMLPKGFQRSIESLGGTVHVNAEVTSVHRDFLGRFVVSYNKDGTQANIHANHVVSNIPIPRLQSILKQSDFSSDYWAALKTVFDSESFLTSATKVGWQSDRKFWEDPESPASVPIYGGISWTSSEMRQMWYPSSGFGDRKGVLTGAYNSGSTAQRWGTLRPEERMKIARAGAAQLHGGEFAVQLKGVAIAWQNIPFIQGGWMSWSRVNNGVESYNRLQSGDRGFYTAGDQMSQLMGWKEGAVLSAMNVVAQITRVRNYKPPRSDVLPPDRTEYN